jgi:predicted Zn-dependent protease
MIDVAVQGLVHSEHELGHTTSFPYAAHPRGADCVMNHENFVAAARVSSGCEPCIHKALKISFLI